MYIIIFLLTLVTLAEKILCREILFLKSLKLIFYKGKLNISNNLIKYTYD